MRKLLIDYLAVVLVILGIAITKWSLEAQKVTLLIVIGGPLAILYFVECMKSLKASSKKGGKK